ncbi:MAG TPA: DHA2 family efflux MFS transporter permease subunit [Actinomycetota bacterium]|nr:DHA2 family efflux MFS transporter permease subunit [Actinomycetota bacterium]
MADEASVAARAGGDPASSGNEHPGATAGGKRKWLVLVAMVFGLFMPMLDNLVVNVALPTMQRELDARVTDLQWIIDAYTLTFASFMLVGGSLGDLFGRKKFFLLGLLVFTLGSLACGLSESTEQLIGFRAVQGLGAALLLPGSLSIITSTFHGKERGTAIGIWAAMSGLAVAVGPLVGGYIVENYSWETIFFINLPVGILGFLLTAIVVRDSRDTTRARRIDLAGFLTGTAGLFCLVYALIEGGAEGWTDDRILAAFGAAAVLLIVFIVIELKSRNPMLPLRFFRNPTFAASNFVAAAVFFALFGTTFFLALYLQNVRGFSPLETGVRLMPFTAAILLISPIAGRLSDRHGSRWLMTIGTLYAAGGMALLLRIQPDSAYESIILPAFVVLGTGMALTMAPMTAAVMASVEPRHAGVASAATNTTRELGGVLGIAVLGALVTSAFKDNLLQYLTTVGMGRQSAQTVVERAAGNAAAGGGSLEAFRRQVPPGTPDSVLAQIAGGARDAFVDAIHSGLLVGVGFLLLASLVAATFVRSHVGQHAEEPEAGREKPEPAPAPIPGQAQIDARTEEVLRDALEPAGDRDQTAAGEEAEDAVAVPSRDEAEPAAINIADVGAPVVTPPFADTAAGDAVGEPAEESEPEQPAPPRRKGRRKVADLAPVAVTDTHYHPEQPPAGNGWTPEEETAGATLASDSYYHLRQLLVDLPIKAGTGDVEQNIQEVALATLDYYRYGLSQPGGDALPVGVTNGAQSSIREDIGVLAGYLDLEKRFGRVSESVASEQAAGAMMAALASRALEGRSSGNGEFIRETVRACLKGTAVRRESQAPAVTEPDGSPTDTSTAAAVPAPTGTPADGPAPQSNEPVRLVYRRRRGAAKPKE